MHAVGVREAGRLVAPRGGYWALDRCGSVSLQTFHCGVEVGNPVSEPNRPADAAAYLELVDRLSLFFIEDFKRGSAQIPAKENRPTRGRFGGCGGLGKPQA